MRSTSCAPITIWRACSHASTSCSTSHGHGRALDGVPTIDTIADCLSAEAASERIDARIVDAAHLLAEKTYGDAPTRPSSRPRERRRLERAKLAVREYRRRMLELMSR